MKLGKIQKIALIQLSVASAMLGVPLKPEGIEKLIEYHPREPEVEIPTEYFMGNNYFVTKPTESGKVILYKK